MEELTEEQIEEFHEAFSLFDKTGEGTIETKELGQVLRSLGIHTNENEKKLYIDKYDPNAIGKIYFNDFLEIIVTKISQSKPEDEIREALRLFETEGNGHIDIEFLKNEFKKYSIGAGNTEVDEICQYLKLDHMEHLINIDDAVDKIMNRIKNHLN